MNNKVSKKRNYTKIILISLAGFLAVTALLLSTFSDKLIGFSDENKLVADIVGNPIIHGDDNAPVTLQEFSSLTCPHCKAFKSEVYPDLLSKHVETGKLKIVSYDFPLDQLALIAATLPRCVASDDREKMLDLLYFAQQDWATTEEPLERLFEVASFAGFNKESFDSCIQNKENINTIIAERSFGEKLGVRGTPSLFINGDPLAGYSLEIVEKAISEAQ